MDQRIILLNPGPVTLTPRVRAALGEGDWCHRESEFAALTQTINRELAAVYAELTQDYQSVMLTGSGTAAVEAMLTSFAPVRGGTLVAANGVYGERMAKILAAQNKPHKVHRQAWLEPLSISGLEACLDEHPELTHIATVHHETTTGRLNDVQAIGALCRERGLQLLLDAVSSFGAEALQGAAWNLSAVAATANKCLHAVPGLSFVLARRCDWQDPPPTVGGVYLNLHSYYAGQHGDGFSPFTQAVQIAFALREALMELREAGGWAQRRALYQSRAAQVYDTLRDRKISTLLDPKEYSSVLWSYELPRPGTYPKIHDALKAAGFVIYAGQAELAKRVFRIAHMGDICSDDLENLRSALNRVFA